MRARPALPLAALLVASLALVACGGGGSKGGAAGKGTALVGLFSVRPAVCSTAGVTGSWFKMVQSGGTVAKGPYISNGDSTCVDHTVTALAPGTDGGLRTGAYQPLGTSPFAADGSTTALRVISATKFFSVGFGISTNPTDPQSKQAVPTPTLRAEGGTLTGDLSAISVSWNGQHFNQGAPKPGGAGPTLTGTYDAATGAYSLEWTSLIKGGPFDGFTGIWHVEGTFTSS